MFMTKHDRAAYESGSVTGCNMMGQGTRGTSDGVNMVYVYWKQEKTYQRCVVQHSAGWNKLDFLCKNISLDGKSVWN
jgi:hypothetical protein